MNELPRKRMQEITSAIARFIALDNRPYSVVEGPGFKNLIEILLPGYIIPHRTTFSRGEIPKLHRVSKCFLKFLMETNIFGISYTMDYWTAVNGEEFLSLRWRSPVSQNFFYEPSFETRRSQLYEAVPLSLVRLQV